MGTRQRTKKSDGGARPFVAGLRCDSVGFVIAPTPNYTTLFEHIRSVEWQTHIRAATDAGCSFVGVGRPDRVDGRGLYAIVRQDDDDALRAAIALAHGRAGEVGSHCTAWLVLADGDIERTALETLATIAPTAGAA